MRSPEFQAVPKELWRDFARRFEEQHHGSLVTVAETETSLLETQPLTAYAASTLYADEEPLEALLMEGLDHDRCTVCVGPDMSTAHSLDAVVGVYLHCDRAGEHKGVRVDATGDRTMLVEFCDVAQRREAGANWL
ncbi:MAG: hypothetical protein HYZ00_13970 [Candidatus Hydrogenedentes bacterium]|nr:hypothetical protein [Candidatus Hydrogenedentota bacterium]